jgi:triosephosphate isomerase
MLIVGNWKAYVDSADRARRLVAYSKRFVSRTKHELVLCPPAPYLGLFAPGNRSRKVNFGAQDVSASTGGAATGEVTAAALAALDVKYVIIGHSERRAMGETGEEIAEKAKRALANGLIPILCIGEKERDLDATYLNAVRGQIATVFAPLSHKERSSIVIAYEPVFAIGKSATEALSPADLTEMVLYIRKVLGEYLPGKAATRVRIIYGGSVDATNARELASGTGIDGFLPGRASTDADAWGGLIKALA